MDLQRPLAPNPYDLLPPVPTFTLTSDDVTDGQPLDEAQVADGGDSSPQLSWSGAPEGTKSFLLVCHDPDAPVIGGFTHWAVHGIPGDVTSLDAGAGGGGKEVAPGATTLTNDYGTADFGGAAPPEGDPQHRYVFTVWALDTEDTGLDADTSVAKAQFMTLGNVLARGSITGTYAQ